MPDARETIRLEVAGRTVTGWTGATVDMAIDQVADGCAFTFPYEPAASNLRDVFRPLAQQALKVYLGDDILLTGRAERIEPKTDAGERSLILHGRALPGALCDCSIDGALELSGLAFSTICRQVAQPFGVAVRADNDTDPIDLVRASYGQRAADFLLSLARPRNLFLNSSYDGKLVISWADSLLKRPVVAALVEGEAPLLHVEAAFDAQRLFSTYKAATQFAGEPDIVAQIDDALVTVYRPLLVAVKDAPIDSESDGTPDAALAAKRARVDAYHAAIQVSATVTGWRRPDGERWAERQMVTLRAPGAMLPVERKWLIASASFRADSGSQTTDFRLVLPETYAGRVPEVLPW